MIARVARLTIAKRVLLRPYRFVDVCGRKARARAERVVQRTVVLKGGCTLSMRLTEQCRGSVVCGGGNMGTLSMSYASPCGTSWGLVMVVSKRMDVAV